MRLNEFRVKCVKVHVEMEQVYRRNINAQEPSVKQCQLIVYYDSLECSSCAVRHLYDKIDLYELADSIESFDVLTVFSPCEEEYDEVMKELMLLDFPYPVYVDSGRNFRRTNSCIPEDRRFHTFLLDRSGHPVFVGNPVASGDLWRLFEKVLGNLVENDGEYRGN